MEAGGVGTELRPKMSTSVSTGDSCFEDRFLMPLSLKLVCSSCRIRHLVFLKFLVVCVSGISFLNEGVEYGCLSLAVIAEFLGYSLCTVMMYT